jgi:hypothetical protein
MRQFVLAFLICAACVPVVRAEVPNAPAPAVIAKAKPKRLKWLRKICSSEVKLAMKLSAIGIE